MFISEIHKTPQEIMGSFSVPFYILESSPSSGHQTVKFILACRCLQPIRRSSIPVRASSTPSRSWPAPAAVSTVVVNRCTTVTATSSRLVGRPSTAPTAKCPSVNLTKTRLSRLFTKNILASRAATSHTNCCTRTTSTDRRRLKWM